MVPVAKGVKGFIKDAKSIKNGQTSTYMYNVEILHGGNLVTVIDVLSKDLVYRQVASKKTKKQHFEMLKNFELSRQQKSDIQRSYSSNYVEKDVQKLRLKRVLSTGSEKEEPQDAKLQQARKLVDHLLDFNGKKAVIDVLLTFNEKFDEVANNADKFNKQDVRKLWKEHQGIRP